MPNVTTPLLADSDRSDNDAGVNRNSRSDQSPSSTHGSFWQTRLREVILFVWAFVATAAVIVLAAWSQHRGQTDGSHSPANAKRNLIFMVSDGMGPASLSLTRSFRQHVNGLPIDDVLTLDRHFWGSSRTRSSNSLVTDSAAGATAFSCGLKSYNGAISTLPDHSPCGTVLEAAKRAGYTTGLVVTTDITDATPACFASHVDYRSQNDEVAAQEVGEGPLGRVVDLMFGGGRCHFLPNTTEGSCRADDVDITKIAREQHGWNYIDSRGGFDALRGGHNVDLPTLGLFAPTDIPFEIDRRNQSDIYPSLSEMAKTALRALEKATANTDKGFFLMIEGSRIDHAGHINDPAAQVREVIEYDNAFKAVLDFLERSEDDGLLVATSDHETGGLSVALQEPGHYPVYNWYPEALKRASASCERLTQRLAAHVSSNPDTTASVDGRIKLRNWINETLVYEGLGITNANDLELSALVAQPENALVIFAEMISLRAHVGWSTHGHSAVDVNVYSSGGPAAEKIRGNVENTDIGKFLADYLNLADGVQAITKELNAQRSSKSIKAVPEMVGQEELLGYQAKGLPKNWGSLEGAQLHL